jgi:hypothetical protein
MAARAGTPVFEFAPLVTPCEKLTAPEVTRVALTIAAQPV